MATYYTKRRQDAVGNRLVAIEQRLARKYPAIDPRAPASLPEKSAGQIAGNGTLAPVPPVTAATPPQESVSGARSYRVVRAFACDDGAPIHLLYGGASIRPAVRQSEQASHHMSAATEALPPYFESFADPIDMAQPTGPIGAHGANQPAQGVLENRPDSQNGAIVTAAPTPAPGPPASAPDPAAGGTRELPARSDLPAPSSTAPAPTPAGGSPAAAPDWSVFDRRAQEPPLSANDDTFVADLQSLLAEAGRRAAKGQETPAVSPAPSAPGSAPDSGQPTAAPAAATAPAATDVSAASQPDNRHGVFDQLSQHLQRATTFDMGTVQVDKTFSQIEASLDAQARRQDAVRRAQAAAQRPPASPLQPIETVEDIALITDPARVRVPDGVPAPAEPTLPLLDGQATPRTIPLAPGAGGRSISVATLQAGDLVLSTWRQAPAWLNRFGPETPVCVAQLSIGEGRVVPSIAEETGPQALDAVIAGAPVAVVLRRPTISLEQVRRLVETASQQSNKRFDSAAIVHLPEVHLDHTGFCEEKAGDERERCLRWRGQVNVGTRTNDRFVCSDLLLQAFAEVGAPLTSATGDIVPERLRQVEHTGTLAYVGHLKYEA